MGVRGELGAELRALRLARGLTLVEAARRAGVSRMSLHRWEAGENAPGTASLLRLLEGMGAEARDRARLAAAADPLHAQPAPKESPLGALAPPGEVLRALREAQDLTQSRLAGSLGVTQPTVARWEAGLAMPGAETLARALALLGAADAGLREDALDLYDPLTDPFDARVRLREEIERIPAPLQDAHLIAMERELWPLAARDPRWEATLVEVLAWRAMVLFTRGEHTAAFDTVRRSIRLAESSGEWDAADLALTTLGVVRSFRGVGSASQLRWAAERIPRFRNPFLRAKWMGGVSELLGCADLAGGRELLARASDLVRESEPDELFGEGRGLGSFDLDGFALAITVTWATAKGRFESTSAPSRLAGRRRSAPKAPAPDGATSHSIA